MYYLGCLVCIIIAQLVHIWEGGIFFYLLLLFLFPFIRFLFAFFLRPVLYFYIMMTITWGKLRVKSSVGFVYLFKIRD